MKKLTILLLSSVFVLSACFEEKPKEPRTVDFFKDPKNIETFKEVLDYCRNNSLWDTDHECESANHVYGAISFVRGVGETFTTDQRQELEVAYTGITVEERKRRKEENAYGAPYQHIDP
ncbi:MAG: EexN family lipoprotein [Zoogloeaceae bacterium]|nr:EexN family lipoprotein [Zoogloeaceae bacterium]